MKILIVEDDFVSRKLVCEILRSHGKIDTAVNGQEAIDAVRMALEENQPYDLICLDIMMPVVDGHQALQAIREMERKRGLNEKTGVRILMVTALDSPKDVFKSYKTGASDYLSKPIMPQTLLAKIRNMGLIA
jgi:two-component system chemotaxis response regulator CheY